MGSSSSSEHGKIYIATEKDAYKAGETISGKVYIQMEKPVPNGGTLFLKFKGWEKTKWSENLFDQIGLNVFYRNSVQLYNWPMGSKIDCESYTFPFSLKTEPTIPGSFLFKGNDNECGEIRYTLKAEIIMHNKSLPKMKNHSQVVIRENYDSYKDDLYKETSLNCVTCYCMSQGTTKLGCQFEQYVYVSGENADLVVAIDNSTCGLPVDAIEAKFIQTITLKDNKGKVKELKKTLLKQDFGRVEPYTKQVGPTANKIALPLISKEKNNKPFEPTTSGDIIVCKYELKVKCQMSGSCLQAEPFVISNVFLYPTALADFGKVEAPPGFNPHVMPVYEFSLSPENQYSNKDGTQPSIKSRTMGATIQSPPQMPGNYNPNQVVPVNNTDNQPLLANQQPTPQQQQPMPQQQQPMPQQQQPIPQQQQPIPQQQPMPQQQQPIPQQQQPILQQQQPIPQQQQPIPQQQQPIPQQQQSMMYQQPMMNQQPQMMNQQPQMMNQQPMMYKQPQMMNQQPIMYQQPQMMNQQPMMYQQPIMMNQQPMMYQQPMMMNQQPMMMNQQPMMMNEQAMIMKEEMMMMKEEELLMQMEQRL